MIGNGTDGSLKITGADTAATLHNFLDVGNAGGHGTVLLTDGAYMSTSGVRIGQGNSTGYMEVRGTGTEWIGHRGDQQLAVNVGAAPGAAGNLLITDGALADITGNLFIADIGTGTVTVSDNASLTTSNQFIIARNEGSNGTLLIESGGSVTTYFAVIANSGTGTATIDGEGSSLTVLTQLLVGRGIGLGERLGTINITRGGIVNANTAEVAFNGTGTVNVEGVGSRLEIVNDLMLGSGGAAGAPRHGTLNLIDGGYAAAENAIIGRTGTGMVNIGGTGSHFEVRDALYFAEKSGTTGHMQIDAGGHVTAENAFIGQAGNAEVIVGGSESHFEVRDTAYLAAEAGSTGHMQIDAGGYASMRAGHIGNRGDATLSVGGSGAALNVEDTLYIGTYGGSSGDVTVHSGGSLLTKRAVISESGTGSATVKGAGSTWQVNEDLILGTSAGTGTLEINDAGHVIAGSVLFGEGAGSSGGTITVDNAALSSGQVWSDEADTAAINFNNGTLQLTRDQSRLFEGMTAGQVNFDTGGAIFDTQGFSIETITELTGVGALTKKGSGTLTLAERANYTGGTLVAQGTLAAGRADVFALTGLHDIAANGTLMLNGFDQTVSDVSNAGTIRLGATSTGTVLTVDDNYIGVGGTIDFNVELGDDTSPADLLVVKGDTSGNSFVRVTNLGGSGAETTGDGIRLVQVEGTSAAEAFELSGPAIGGAYAYDLFHNGIADPLDGNWYLRSSGLAPTVPVYENYPQLLLGMVALPTLEQRVGERHRAAETGSPAANRTAIWARIEAAHSRNKASASVTKASYDTDTTLLQLGVDGRLASTETGLLIGGVTAQISHASAKIHSDFGDGSNKTSGHAFGATLTWYDDNGFYVDGQAQFGVLSSDLSAGTLGGIGDDIHGKGYALSLETGRKIALDSNWSLTPQAQLAYSSVNFDTFTDPFGAEVSLQRGDSLKGRLGIAANFMPDASDSHIHGIANLTYEFLNGTSVLVSGIDANFKPQRFGGELGLGGTYKWGDGKYALNGEALASTSFEGGYGFKGTIGFTVGF